MLDMNEPQWYVLKTQHGYEDVAEKALNDMVALNPELQDKIFKVVVIRDEVMEERANGKRKLVVKKRFPNYLFIKMIYTKDVWYVVKNCRGVQDFLTDAKKIPLPMTPDEVKRTQLEEVKVEDLKIAVGDTVNIVAGPFKDWTGEVMEIKAEEQKVKVNIQIYGRPTAMDLDFAQVEKI